jgi:hypothetical protein
LIDRRGFLTSALGAGAAALGVGACGREPSPPPYDGWDAGDVAHLLPTANHQRFRLKASFTAPQPEPPELRVGERRVTGVRSDTRGRFFAFDVDGLEPQTRYTLRLHAASGRPLCAAWPLATLPAPDAEPERFRLLAYTCAGGPDDLYNFGFFNAYLPIAHRQQLFARALEFEPDAVVANGDHVYWDLKSKFGWAMGRSPRAWWTAGLFDRERPVLGTENEEVLVRAFGPQIAGLYGVRFRSVPMFFLQDDHDYGENDEASAELRTFPPDAFMLDLARTTQRLYYPELLADETTPPRYVRSGGVSESFGSLRFGQLFEGLLYDCRRFMTNSTDPDLKQRESRFVPGDVEHWLLLRSAVSPCAHLAHMPSTPLLWSAGKWAEWYPDFKDADGQLRPGVGKPYWPAGWAEQHDRLVKAVSARRDRTALFVSGDLHATAIGRMHATNGQSLDANPVVSLLSGAIGTGAMGWPSQFRGQLPVPSGTVEAEEIVAPIEENGFSILDFTPHDMRVSLFRWSPAQPEEAIASLEPFRTLVLSRPGRG